MHHDPRGPKIICQAFDEAWNSIAGNFGSDLATIEAARIKLANIILAFPHNEITDAEQIKRSSSSIYGASVSKFRHALSGRSPSHQQDRLQRKMRQLLLFQWLSGRKSLRCHEFWCVRSRILDG